MSKPNGHTESCGNCRFWKRQTPGHPDGLCRGGRPTVLLVGMAPHPLSPKQGVPMVNSFWPPAPESEWCGDWEEKKASAASYSTIDLSKLKELPEA